MRLETKVLLLAAALLLGTVLALMLWPTPAKAQPPGLGSDWTANGWTTWTVVRDSLPDIGADTTDCKMVGIRSTGVSKADPDTFSLGKMPGGVTSRLLLYFDVSFIPSTQVVVDAVLGLSAPTFKGVADATTYTLDVYRVQKTWYETGVTPNWTNARTSATPFAWSSVGCGAAGIWWNQGGTSVPDPWILDVNYWGLTGSEPSTVQSTPDFIQTVGSRCEFKSDGTAYPMPLRVRITDMVRGWHTGRYVNRGMRLSFSNETSGSTSYVTLHGTGFSGSHRKRPVLWVATVAEPGSGGAGSLGQGKYGVH